MNYLEIINKCLSELNYKQADSFDDLVKPEHQRIMNHINLISHELCTSDNWNFLLRRDVLTLPKGDAEIQNTINGRILVVYIDGKKYKYCEDFQRFMSDEKLKGLFSVFNDKMLFPKFDEEKLINIIYYTKNMAISSDGTEKLQLEYADDRSLIPEMFAKQILVFGTCLCLKGEPEHAKFSYWQSMYNSAVAMMRSKIAVDAEYAPVVKIFRH